MSSTSTLPRSAGLASSPAALFSCPVIVTCHSKDRILPAHRIVRSPTSAPIRTHYWASPVACKAVLSPPPELPVTTSHAKDTSCTPDVDSEYSEEALVSDYQYCLRYFRALKRQVGPWQAEFVRVHGRQPEPEDAAAHGGAEWAERLAALQEVRKRLLGELPRLRLRLQQQQQQHRGPAAVDTASVAAAGGRQRDRGANANASTGTLAPAGPAGSAGGAANHPNHNHQGQQVVDSVSTWLRADRYRRQRAMAAAAVAEAAAQVGVQAVGTFSAASAVGASGGAASGGVGSSQLVPHAPYQPVIQLNPLLQPEDHPQLQPSAPTAAAGAGTGTGTGAAHGPGLGHVSGAGRAEGAGGEAAATALPPALSPQLRRIMVDNAAGTVGTGSSTGAAAPAPVVGCNREGVSSGDGAAAGRSAAGAPAAAMAAPQQAAVAAAAAGADSGRAKNALLAALQYKSKKKDSGDAAPGGGGKARAGPGAGVEEAAVGPDRVPAGLAESGVDGVARVVEKGDTRGAYMGRVRRVEQLPESFLLCP